MLRIATACLFGLSALPCANKVLVLIDGRTVYTPLIHIITRSAVGMQGGAALLHGGDQERGAAAP